MITATKKTAGWVGFGLYQPSAMAEEGLKETPGEFLEMSTGGIA